MGRPLFIHLLLNGLFFLAILINAARNSHAQSFLWIFFFSILTSIYLKVELLGHVVTLWLTF